MGCNGAKFKLDSDQIVCDDRVNRENVHDAAFEVAGPRERLYFESSNTTAAIVTCGGLCPGINDVPGDGSRIASALVIAHAIWQAAIKISPNSAITRPRGNGLPRPSTISLTFCGPREVPSIGPPGARLPTGWPTYSSKISLNTRVVSEAAWASGPKM
jgi:hypothetical protein